MRSVDVFSCIGCHAIGLGRAGIETTAFCEINPFRRAELAKRFPAIPVDARSAGEFGMARREMIEALGDSNPPHMAEVIGLAIMEAT